MLTLYMLILFIFQMGSILLGDQFIEIVPILRATSLRKKRRVNDYIVPFDSNQNSHSVNLKPVPLISFSKPIVRALNISDDFPVL